MKEKENWLETKVKDRVQDRACHRTDRKPAGCGLRSTTYIFEELLSQLLDVVHDLVRTRLLLSNPFHMIGDQLWMWDRVTFQFPESHT